MKSVADVFAAQRLPSSCWLVRANRRAQRVKSASRERGVRDGDGLLADYCSDV
jgi:hypothetical protein